MKILKYTLIGVGVLIGLVAAALVVFALTFDPNDYKPLIVKMVKEKKQRTLTIEGDIKLAFWPKIGADLGRVALSERNGGREFAAVQSARVFVAVMPLLERRLVVDTVHLDGVRAHLVRFRDGTTNFDDLLSKEESEEIQFDIDGVVVRNAALDLTDEMDNRHVRIDGMSLKTGHITKDQPIDLETQFHVMADNPKMNAQAEIKGRLLVDAGHKLFTAQGLDATLQGDIDRAHGLEVKITGDLEIKPQMGELLLDDLKLVAKASLDGKTLAVNLATPGLSVRKDEVSGKDVRLAVTHGRGDDVMTARLTVADLEGSPRGFQSSGISGEISGRQGTRTLAGQFASPINGNLETRVFELPRLVGRIDVKDPALPRGVAKIALDLNARADLKQQRAAATLAADIDGSQVKGRLDVVGFDRPNVRFDLTADQLDFNKLLGKSQAATPATHKPANLSALKNVLAQGNIAIGSIVYAQYRIAHFAATLKADGQALTVSPLSLKLDDSQIRGQIGVRHFDQPLYTFDLDIDRLDADRYLPKGDGKSKTDQPLDLSALKALNAAGVLRIGSLKTGQFTASNIRIDVKANGDKLEIDPLSLKIDNSQIRGNVSVSQFASPVFGFDLDIDRLDANRYLAAGGSPAAAEKKPLDLGILKQIKAHGNLRIAELKYDRYQITGLRTGLRADGQRLSLSPLVAKVDDSTVNATLGVSRFEQPVFSFDMDIDRLDADRYLTPSQPTAKSSGDTPIDLTPLKTLNASGDARIGWLKLANVKTSNVKLAFKAADGQVALAPFSANLYQGAMAGTLHVDARTTPTIAFKQEMKNITIGPLLVDAINNDMLDGRGTLSLDVKTQGATTGALKRALNGSAVVQLADGAIKGFDLAGTIREIKTKLNAFKAQGNVGVDRRKKTDFSEMKASFVIKNGVAHNDDLVIKAPLFRITGSGDIDIGNERLDYLAKPTVVATLKGQGGPELEALNGMTIPVKVTGSFSDPKYALDFAAIGAALAQKNLLGNMAGSKGDAVQKLLSGDKTGALESLMGGKHESAATPAAPAPTSAPDAAPAQATGGATPDAAPAAAPPAQPEHPPKPTPEEKIRKKLNKLLGL
ncbi:MAG: AsmA family protein [Methylophilaceae bacterium]|nr:AsmA family protein [Methylophilaceae bacterium]